jgi:hypothetical protein
LYVGQCLCLHERLDMGSRCDRLTAAR